jgi:alpha-galactosidase
LGERKKIVEGCRLHPSVKREEIRNDGETNMRKQAFLCGLVVVLFLGSTTLGLAAESADSGDSTLLAATPPMGWNSWDGYGTTVKEADVKANAQWLAEHLKPFGWQYVVVDMEWYVTNPIPEGNSKT